MSADRLSRHVVLKIDSQLLRQATERPNSLLPSSPAPPSSPLKPPSPPPGIFDSTANFKRKLAGASAGVKKKKRLETPSSPLIYPSDPPTRPISALGGLSNGNTGASTPTGPASLQPAAHAKLGPKSNQGSINDKLRALDRSGRPCRRWTKVPLKLKSFTGWEWSVSSWYGGQISGPIVESKQEAAQEDDTPVTSTEPPAPPPLTITIPAMKGRDKDEP
ncbi:INO80 complex subunit Ies4-domain-containing protein [Lipomyces japonicus]|uniref:INO80 complex subunit Ies4-domain-containing protein n=1 Tax=Lipomyces japonicus TaxID=56871 RepID=UPI0034CF3E5E